MNGKTIIDISRDDIICRLEEGAKRRLGVSAMEMLRRYREDDLEDPGLVVDLIMLSKVLEKSDPYHI